MKAIDRWSLLALVLACGPLAAQEPMESPSGQPQENAWTKSLEDRSQRGTLHDSFQKVRGDSGKWNDDPRLQHAPPIAQKPPKMSLDDWADLLQRTRLAPTTSSDDNWLLFKTRQLDDNDRVWISEIRREGNAFTVVLDQAIWQGRYFKTFTYYNVLGVNLGKLPPGQYEAKWIVRPLVFKQFDGNGRPRGPDRKENQSLDESRAKKEAKQLSVKFTVADS